MPGTTAALLYQNNQEYTPTRTQHLILSASSTSFDGLDGYDATLTWWRSRVRAPVEVLSFFQHLQCQGTFISFSPKYSTVLVPNYNCGNPFEEAYTQPIFPLHNLPGINLRWSGWLWRHLDMRSRDRAPVKALFSFKPFAMSSFFFAYSPQSSVLVPLLLVYYSTSKCGNPFEEAYPHPISSTQPTWYQVPMV